MKSKNPILLIENDMVDAMTVERAFNEINVSNEIVWKQNGEEGLKHLLDTQESTEFPCLILLDLNMPKMNGIEFLKEKAKHQSLIPTPVVVLTTSHQDQDKLDCYLLNIAGYMIKPVDYRQFVELMKIINLYFTISETLD